MQNNSFYARIDRLDACLVRRDEVISLLSSGQMIKAIKVYREDTGASLSDAKIAVERMDQQMRLGMPPLAKQTPMVAADEALDTYAWQDEVGALLRQKRKIQAIKLYREQTGVGLREAKEAVERMEQGLPVDSMSPLPIMACSSEDVLRLILEKKKIQAIKLYREQTGVGLHEAKNAVDQMEEALQVGSEPRAFESPPVETYPSEEMRRLLMEGKIMQVLKMRVKQNWR